MVKRRNNAGGTAVFHGADVAARDTARGILLGGDFAGIAAVAYGCLVIADNAASMLDGLANNRSGIGAVFHGALVVANDAADIILSTEIGIRQIQILYHAICAQGANQSGRVCAVSGIQTGNGMLAAVESTAVGRTVFADGSPDTETALVQRAVLCQHVFVDGKVSGHQSVGIRRAAVDQLCEPIEVTCVANLIHTVHHQGRLVAAAGADAVSS